MADKDIKEIQEAAAGGATEAPAAFGDKVAKNKKTIVGIIVAVIVVALGCLGWWYYEKSANEKSAKAFSTAYTNGIKKGGDEAAMQKELEAVAKAEAGKAGGTQANLTLAAIYIDNDEYQKALNALDATDIKEPVMKMSATILKGDCYVGLNKLNEALAEYDKAYSEAKDTNPEIAVRALMKKASVLDAQKKNSEALAIYEQIQKDYPDVLEQSANFAGQNPDNMPLSDDDIEAKAENERARTGK